MQAVDELMKMAYKYYDDIALPKLVLFNLFRAFVAANLDVWGWFMD